MIDAQSRRLSIRIDRIDGERTSQHRSARSCSGWTRRRTAVARSTAFEGHSLPLDSSGVVIISNDVSRSRRCVRCRWPVDSVRRIRRLERLHTAQMRDEIDRPNVQQTSVDRNICVHIRLTTRDTYLNDEESVDNKCFISFESDSCANYVNLLNNYENS
jgi:hypothetical protein